VKLPFQLRTDADHAEILLEPDQGTKAEDLKSAVEAVGLGQYASASLDEGQVRIHISEVSSRILQTLRAHYEPGNPIEHRRTEQVGPQVGEELKTSALLALGLGLFAQLVYITARFEFRYALGAITALFHDVFVAITVLALLYYEIDMPVVAAILTVLGYSMNDKIVVFDRMREKAAVGRKQGFIALINTSTNEMLSRTLLTSMSIGSAFILWLFGGEALKSFAMALTIGIIAGTYSSVYVAAPVAYYYDKWRQRRAHRPLGRPPVNPKEAVRR
jgi:preprotein translocase subunit SecF